MKYYLKKTVNVKDRTYKLYLEGEDKKHYQVLANLLYVDNWIDDYKGYRTAIVYTIIENYNKATINEEYLRVWPQDNFVAEGRIKP